MYTVKFCLSSFDCQSFFDLKFGRVAKLLDNKCTKCQDDSNDSKNT